MVVLNIRAVKALRRAISTVLGGAPSSRSATIIWPERSSTTAALLAPLARHSLIVVVAMVIAMPSDNVRCEITP